MNLNELKAKYAMDKSFSALSSEQQKKILAKTRTPKGRLSAAQEST